MLYNPELRGSCRGQLGAVATEDREASIDTPADIVELDVHVGDLFVSGDFEKVESVDGDHFATDAGHVPVPQDIRATGDHGLVCGDVGD